MSNPNVSGSPPRWRLSQSGVKDARCPSGRVALRRDRNGQDAHLSNGTGCGTISPFPKGEKEMRTMSKTIERPRLDEDVVPFTEYRVLP